MPWDKNWNAETYKEGYRAGKEWAKHGVRSLHPNYGIKAVHRFYEEHRTRWSKLWEGPAPPNFSDVVSILLPLQDNDPRDFWHPMTCFRSPSLIQKVEFLLGFFEGVLQLRPARQDVENKTEGIDVSVVFGLNTTDVLNVLGQLPDQT